MRALRSSHISIVLWNISLLSWWYQFSSPPVWHMMFLFLLHMKAIGFHYKLMDAQPQSALCGWIILTSSALFLSCSSLQLFVLARVGLSPDSSCLKSFPPTHVSLSIHLIFNGSSIIFSFALAKTILRRQRDRISHLPIFLEQTGSCRRQALRGICQELFFS